MVAETEWVAGIHAVREMLQQGEGSIETLLVQSGRNDNRVQELLRLAETAGIEIKRVSRRELDSIAGGRHQGVAARGRVTGTTRDEAFLPGFLAGLDHPPLLLILDEITDPHNLGACLRTADGAGVDAVIVPKDGSAPLNMTVRKVASGAAETIPLVVVTNLKRVLDELKDRGIWLCGTDDAAPKTVFEQDLTGPLALVMGSEGKGMRRLTRESCDYLVSIPMAGSIGSLNVSVATGVCLYEAVRQRGV